MSNSSERDVYVSIKPNNFVSGKSNGLQGQANLLKIMKVVNNLKILSRQRRDLKERLHKLLDQVVKEVNKIEDKFPKPEIPENLRRKVKKSYGKTKYADNLDLKIKRDYSKRDEIDQELFEIQRKLSVLNG